jgi:hypothetical protein
VGWEVGALGPSRVLQAVADLPYLGVSRGPALKVEGS